MPRSTVRRNLRQRTVSEPTLALSTSEEETGHRTSLRFPASPSGRNVTSPAAAPSSANPLLRVSIAPIHTAQLVGAAGTAKPQGGFQPWQVALAVLYFIAAAAALAVFRPTWTYPPPSTSSVLAPPSAQPPVQVRPQPPSERAAAAASDWMGGSLRAARGPPRQLATAASSSSLASPWLLDAWAADAADTGAAALPPAAGGAALARSAAPPPPLPASLGLSLPAVAANIGLTLPPLPPVDQELGAADADSPPYSVQHVCSYPMLDFSTPVVSGHSSSAAAADAESAGAGSSGASAAHTSISLAYAPWRVRWPTFLLRDHELWWEQYKVRPPAVAHYQWERGGREGFLSFHSRDLSPPLPPHRSSGGATTRAAPRRRAGCPSATSRTSAAASPCGRT